jgi:hypothetical protein
MKDAEAKNQVPVTKQEVAEMFMIFENSILTAMDERFERLQTYMASGFELLDNKLDYIEERLTTKISGLDGRVDFVASNKIGKAEHKELEKEVAMLVEGYLATHEEED